MHRALHVVIAFILALAIPLQGIAAATMAACGNQHSMGHATALGQRGSDRTAKASEHRAMHHRVHTSSHGASDTDSHARHGSLDKLAKVKCSICASCCACAAMPSTFVVFDSAAPTECFASPVPTGTPAFLTAGLERPPRAFFA